MAGGEHPNKHIREALRYAEQHGWRVEKAGGHAHCWGFMYCPRGQRDGCHKSIYSTPKNPQNHAKELRRWVDRLLPRPRNVTCTPMNSRSI